MALVQTGIKSTMSTVKYTAGSLMLWAYFIWVLDILYRYMVSWILAITDR